MLERIEYSTTRDGVVDRTELYEDGVIVGVELEADPTTCRPRSVGDVTSRDQPVQAFSVVSSRRRSLFRSALNRSSSTAE